MTTMATDGNGDGTPTSERALRWIGDLDHPFYDDERNRFIWYEASAIAFQMFLLANLATAGLMLWIGGSDALPYALAVLAVNTIVAITGVQYANRRYAEYTPRKTDFTRSRGVFSVALGLFAMTGLARALSFDGPAESDATESVGILEVAGFITGVVTGLAIPIAIVLFLKRRRGSQAANDDEDFDEF